MTDVLEDTLTMWKRTVFEWGKTDCLLSVADYIVDCGGPDGGAAFRGMYNTEAAAFAHMDAHGGAAALIDATGLARTDEPVSGDVVVIETTDGDVAGLLYADTVAVRREQGVAFLGMRFVTIAAAWEIQSCRL